MQRFSRSWMTSLFTSALDFGTLAALVELFKVDYVLATWLGTAVGSLSNFFINRYWAFSAATASPTGQFARFLPVQIGSSVLQTAGVWLLTRFVGLPYLGSKLAVAVAVYLGWNYPMNRSFVFRAPSRAPALEKPDAPSPSSATSSSTSSPTSSPTTGGPAAG